MHRKRNSAIFARRSVLVAVVAVLCVAFAIGTAMAWTDFSQSKVNTFRGTTDPDVTLHDEFDGENKDIFVENSGTQELYVRVRLDEYMEIGGTSFDPAATAKNKDSWKPHAWPQDGSNAADCNCINDGDPNHKFHAYHTWQVTGAQRKYNPGTPGLVYTKLDDVTKKVDLTTGPKDTQSAIAPITMAKYIELKGKAESQTAIDWGVEAAMTAEEFAIWTKLTTTGCWILDSDGWAYWSVALKSETATNLLLDEVKPTGKDFSDDWIYRINVKLQAVTLNDVGDLTAPSAGATALINSWKA